MIVFATKIIQRHVFSVCGAVERKNYLKEQLNRDAFGTDIAAGPVPDINLLTCLVADFLKELPEPLVPAEIWTMLLDAQEAILPADADGNQAILLKIIDCLPHINRVSRRASERARADKNSSFQNTLVLLVDHIKLLLASEPHNGLTLTRVCAIFGKQIFMKTFTRVKRSVNKSIKVFNIPWGVIMHIDNFSLVKMAYCNLSI